MARVTAAAATSALVAAMVVGGPTAMAGTRVRVVDDDGNAKPGACGAATSARTSIQDAIDDSGPGDVVQICPGTYTETLRVDPGRRGLVVRAIGQGLVILRRPAGAVEPTLEVENDETHWVGHDIRLRMRTSGDCVSVPDAVLVQEADDVILEDLRISVTGGGDSFLCGYQTGVRVTDSTNVRILDAVISDWQQDGVRFDDGGRGRVVDGTFRWVHTGVDPVSVSTSPAGGPSSRAVSMFDGGRALVRDTRIEADAAAGPDLQGGIVVANPGSRATIVGTTIRRASVGLFLSYDSSAVARDNDVRKGQGPGIWLYEGGTAEVDRNRVTGYGGPGIQVESEGNQITGNNARGNAGADCRDLTSGDGSQGTGNTWTRNRGDADPIGICIP